MSFSVSKVFFLTKQLQRRHCYRRSFKCFYCCCIVCKCLIVHAHVLWYRSLRFSPLSLYAPNKNNLQEKQFSTLAMKHSKLFVKTATSRFSATSAISVTISISTVSSRSSPIIWRMYDSLSPSTNSLVPCTLQLQDGNINTRKKYEGCLPRTRAGAMMNRWTEQPNDRPLCTVSQSRTTKINVITYFNPSYLY